jgi:DNA-binding transcriptional MerR regulator
MFDFPRFTMTQAAGAAGMSLQTLSTWVRRGHVPYVEDKEGDMPEMASNSSGRGAMFNRRAVLRLSIMAHLTEIGMSLDVAREVAIRYAELSEPLSDDRTVLLIGFSHGAKPSVYAMRRPRAENVLKLTKIERTEIEGGNFLIIDLAPIVRNVNAALGTE